MARAVQRGFGEVVGFVCLFVLTQSFLVGGSLSAVEQLSTTLVLFLT